MIVDTLRNLNRTIISTIHQPRYEVLKKFDKVMLMAKGYTVYFGKVNDELLDYFQNCGFNCPKFENPADFIIRSINTTETRDQNVTKLIEYYQASNNKIQAEKNDFNDQPKYLDTLKSTNDALLVDANSYTSSFYHQFKILLHRSFLHKLREPLALQTQAYSSIVIPLFVCTLYWIIPNTQEGITDRTRAGSMIMLMQAFMCYDVLLLWPRKSYLFKRIWCWFIFNYSLLCW